MQFLVNSKIDFMKYRHFFVWVSVALLAVSAVQLLFLGGLNLGIDFAGGTQLQVHFKDRVEVDDVRRIFEDAGFPDAQIQQFGDAAQNEVLIKTPVTAGSEEGQAAALVEALEQAMNKDLAGGFDLNQRGSEAVATQLDAADPDGRLTAGDSPEEQRAYYDEVADAVLAARKGVKLFSSWDQLSGIDGVSEAAVGVLREQASLGAFHVLSTENVGPQIGSELRNKGLWAVAMSLLGMLAYIWARFELRFGIGALVAVFHDFLIVLGLYGLFQYEFNLPTIAAFLTLVGYSVNDTVVIFDRVRENMRRSRRRPLVDTMNVSLNQTLSRTILTSSTTLMTVGCLFFFGGEVIRGFAFVLLIGVVVGTYSSIFVASPFALMWERVFGAEAKERKRATA